MQSLLGDKSPCRQDTLETSLLGGETPQREALRRENLVEVKLFYHPYINAVLFVHPLFWVYIGRGV